jgi:hypothetical protein
MPRDGQDRANAHHKPLQAAQHLYVTSTGTDQLTNREKRKRAVITTIAIGIMAILATGAAAAHLASSYGSYHKVELREMENKVDVIKSATLNGLENIEKQVQLTEKRHFTTLQALHQEQAAIKRGDNSTWYYHWVNLAISSAKRQVTNTENIINAAARGHAHITLLDNRNLT